MLKWFSQDTPFMQGLHTFANLAVLNLLWLLCCLPVFTIGASTTALYRCLFDQSQGEYGGYRSFFCAFKRSFKTATLSWLIMAGASLILYADYRYTLQQSWTFRPVLLAAYGVVAFVILLASPFLFALISQFSAKLGQTLKNALLCGVSWLPRTVLMLALWAIPVLWVLISPYWFLYFAWGWIACGFSLIAFLCVRVMKKPMQALKARMPLAEAASGDKE
jgi:uncharacterized membrane protein YesL